MATTETGQAPAIGVDPLRFHKHYTAGKDGDSPYAGGSSFMERVSEAVASGPFWSRTPPTEPPNGIQT